MNEIQTLEKAIELVGGVSALAKKLGTSQSTVSNWRMRGSVPAGWLKAIQLQFKRQLSKEAANG